MSESNLLKFSSLGIYLHQIIKDLNMIFIEFIMLLGAGEPTFNLSFNFSEVLLNLQNK